MTDGDRLIRLRGRALKAEELADRQRRQIEWLAGRLAAEVGKAKDGDGNEICGYLPPSIRESLCHRGVAGCAECWADTAEGEVNGLEFYLRPEFRIRGMDESAEDFLRRKRGEAGCAVRVIYFSTGLPKEAGR